MTKFTSSTSVSGVAMFILMVPLQITGVLSQFVNLPDVPEGVFNVSTSIEMNTTVTAAWDALTNFRGYPDWNPFVRAIVAVSPENVTLPNQYPVEGDRLFMRTQIPPLPLPVTRDTPDNVLYTQYAYDIVTHVQPKQGRLAWEYEDSSVGLMAERWQALTDLGCGKVLYESREVFSGPTAGLLKDLMQPSLQLAFDAQGEGMKLLLEGSSESEDE